MSPVHMAVILLSGSKHVFVFYGVPSVLLGAFFLHPVLGTVQMWCLRAISVWGSAGLTGGRYSLLSLVLNTQNVVLQAREATVAGIVRSVGSLGVLASPWSASCRNSTWFFRGSFMKE